MFSNCMHSGQFFGRKHHQDQGRQGEVDDDILIVTSCTTGKQGEERILTSKFSDCEEEKSAKDEVMLGVGIYHLDTEFKKCSVDAIVSSMKQKQTAMSSREQQKNKNILKKKRIFSRWMNKNCEREEVAAAANNGKKVTRLSPNIYDIVDSVIKEKGRKNVICPRDGRLGAA